MNCKEEIVAALQACKASEVEELYPRILGNSRGVSTNLINEAILYGCNYKGIQLLYNAYRRDRHNTKKDRTQLALHYAARADNVEAFNFFEPMDACSQFDRSGMKPIHIAALHGSLSVLNSLLMLPEKHDLREPCQHGKIPLFYAVKGGSPAAVEALLTHARWQTPEEAGDIWKCLLEMFDYPENNLIEIFRLLSTAPVECIILLEIIMATELSRLKELREKGQVRLANAIKNFVF